MATIALPGKEAPRRLPILAGFVKEVLPVLLLLWTGLIVAYLVTERDYLWFLLPWATVTTIMLWPVGRSLGRGYFTYRRILFIVGVLSMAYIPFIGFMLGTNIPYKVKLALFILLPVDLTVFAILPSLRWAIGKPLQMFFRPDLLFGDGRVLCCGAIAFVLGLRYFVGHPPPEGIPVPIPKWDWYGIFFAVVFGFIPLIALRGITKLLMRLRRMRDDAWRGWGMVFLREVWLVLTLLAIGFGFHNAFKGTHPFVISHHVLHNWSWVPIVTMALAALFLIFVRGGFKKLIGDPFIKERVWQSFVKQVLLVVGLLVLMWSFMSILDTELMDVKHAGYRPIENQARLEHLEHLEKKEMAGKAMHEPRRGPASGFILPGIKGIFIGRWNWVGVAFILWGLIVLVPFRVLAQHYQRHAIVAQMAAVIIPHQRPEHRQRLVQKMMLDGLLEMPFGQRRSYMVTMNRALAGAPDEAREATTQAMVGVLADLPTTQRRTIMETQAAALGELTNQERVTRMADMMGAVSQLPEEKRRIIMQVMASLLR